MIFVVSAGRDGIMSVNSISPGEKDKVVSLFAVL